MTDTDTDPMPKVTAEGGPLDGERFTVDETSTTLRALAIKDGDKWVDPRKWAAANGFEIPEMAPPRSWPADVRVRVVPVEYLIDREHETAAFREPAQIRETPGVEPEREWARVDPRKTQEARWIAWKAIATALEALPSLDDPACPHTPPCTTVPMCLGRTAIDAVTDDGLRIVEPTRLTDAAETLAALIHETREEIAHEQAIVQVPWDQLSEDFRAQSVDVAQHVLGSLDAHGRVVVVSVPETAPLDMDFEGLAGILRDEAGAALTLALPAQLGITMQTLDEEQMRANGWQRVRPSAPPVEFDAGPLVRTVYTSCPHCDESFTVEIGESNNDETPRAVNEMAGALHEHLNDEHPNVEHREVTVHLLEGAETYEVSS